MGYTIYYKTKPNLRITKKEVVECVKRIKDLITENDLVEVQFPDAVDKYNINFNGIGDDSHETFCFYSDYKDSKFEEEKQRVIDKLTEQKSYSGDIINGKLEFCFCKTARKPYDKVVKQALMIIQEVTSHKLVVSCDGENEETDFPEWVEEVKNCDNSNYNWGDL